MSFLWAMLGNPQVVNALWVGTTVAAGSGAIGVFVVIRGQAFAGHVLTDVGAAGAAGSLLIGANVWYGFVSFGLLAGSGIEILGGRARNRDVVTGIILSFAMGLEALLLFLVNRYTTNVGSTMLVLFGSLFAAAPSLTPLVSGLGLGMAALLLLIYRPLLLCSVNPEIAQSRGVRVRLVGILFMLLLVLAVENGAMVIGALLSTALLIGPAAIAIRLTARTGWAVFLAAWIGVAVTWLGILLAYASYYWPPYGRGWPVSFFISSLLFVVYLGLRLGPTVAAGWTATTTWAGGAWGKNADPTSKRPSGKGA